MSQARRPDGAKIRRLREDQGLNVRQLAERVGIARQYLSLIELGRRKQTSLDTICGIARELGEPLDNLVVIAGRQRDEEAEAA
jgi:transcriptional regulator with XRE-family HTH domain